MVADELEAQLRAIAMIILAAAVLLFVVGALINRHSSVKVTSKLGDVQFTLGEMHEEVRAINHAVNHVSDDDPAPLIDRVRDLEAHGKWERTVLHLLGRHLGVPLPPHPKDQTS